MRRGSGVDDPNAVGGGFRHRGDGEYSKQLCELVARLLVFVFPSSVFVAASAD